MKRTGKYASLLLLIIFLAACADGQDNTPEERWKKAYDAGLACQQAGDLKKAKQNYCDSIQCLGDHKPSEKSARSALSLASILLEEKDCAGALSKAEEAMAIFESKWNPLKASSSLDESGSNFLNSMLIVGRSLNCLGRYREALPILERTRSLQASVIVPVKFNHELAAALRSALAATGNRKAAHELRDQLRSTESSLSENDLQDISKLTYRQALEDGNSAEEGGNRYAAEKLLKHAVQEARKNGEDSMEMAEALLSLGDVYASQTKYSQARPMLERALALARKHLEKHDRQLKDYLKRLASFYANNSEWKKAAALDEEALTLIFADEYKKDKHCHRSRVLMEALIEIYKKDGQLDKAEKLARRKLDLEAEGYGKDSRKVGATACQLAQVLALRKNDREAEKYFALSFSLLKSNKNTDPRDMDKTGAEFSNFLEKKGDKVRAQKIRAEVKAMNQEIVDGLAGKDRH